MRLCRLGEDLGILGRWGDTLEAGDEPGLGQRNFRTDPRSGGEAAGMRHPDARAWCRYVTAIHVELPGHEPVPGEWSTFWDCSCSRSIACPLGKPSPYCAQL